MKRIRSSTFLILMSVLASGPTLQAKAATFDDPSWPCQQRKVETLSLGLMWPASGTDTQPGAETELPKDAQTLAGRLELRRTSLEQAEQLVAAFTETHPGANEQLLKTIFSEIFDRLGKRRSKIIAGIGRYSVKQIDLAKKIDATRAEMDEAMAQKQPDFDRIDQLEEQLDWDERVYHDRARSLTYVCETPVLIEKRLYALAQILLKHAPK
ncbi:hypothetical protein FMN50_14195 [Rhodobacterales bacterium]|nr:hypothetical protein FMN50_14195 [Rhodobacterales bacterium]